MSDLLDFVGALTGLYEGPIAFDLDGVPYPMISCDMAEFDMMVQTAGFQSYPAIFATDMSQTPPLRR